MWFSAFLYIVLYCGLLFYTVVFLGILVYKTLVSVFTSVCLLCWFLSIVHSVWGVWGIVGTGLARACCILSLPQFHALLHAISRDFHTISCNFGYISSFWANFNMLGIKLHVLKLRNLTVMLSRTFTHSLVQFHAIFTQFWLFQPFEPIQTCWVQKCR